MTVNVKKEEPIFSVDDLIAPDKMGRKPTILVNIGTDDPTRGDSAGRKGLANNIAKKINADVLYADKKKLDKLYPKEEDYQKQLLLFLSQHRTPDIVFGEYSSGALGHLGKDTNQTYYIGEINEELSSSLLNEENIVAHHLTDDMLAEEGWKFDEAYPDLKQPIIAVFLVDPYEDYHTNFAEKIASISDRYEEATIFLCGSRRTKPFYYNKLKNTLEQRLEKLPGNITVTGFEFDRNAEFNPYRGLIARAEHFILWGNSMSMMSEPLITGKTVHLYQYGNIDPDLKKRGIVSEFNIDVKANNKPLLTRHFKSINITDQLADKILDRFKRKTTHIINDKKKKYSDLPVEWHNHLLRIYFNHHHIKETPEELRDDYAFIKSALEQNGMAIEHLTFMQQNNSELGKVALANNKEALPFIGKKLKDNDDAMLYVIRSQETRHQIDMYEHCSRRLRDCPIFTARLLEAGINIYSCIDKRLLNDETNAINLVKMYGSYIEKIPENLIDDEDFIIKAVTANSDCFRYLSLKYRDTEKIAKIALEADPYTISYIGDKMRDNEKFMLDRMDVYPSDIRYVSKRLRVDEGFIKKSFEYGDVTNYIDPIHFTDPEIMILSLKSHLNNFQYCDDILKENPEFLLKCAREVPDFPAHLISNSLQDNLSFMKDLTDIKPDFLQFPQYIEAREKYRDKQGKKVTPAFNAHELGQSIDAIKTFQKQQKKTLTMTPK